MTDLKSKAYLIDYTKFYGGTTVQYTGPESEIGIFVRNVIYTVYDFVDLSDSKVFIKNAGVIRGRLLIRIKLPNGKKTCYVPAYNFKKV